MPSHPERSLSRTFTRHKPVHDYGLRPHTDAGPVASVDIASFRTFDANAVRSHRLDTRHMAGGLSGFQSDHQKFCLAA